MSSRQLTSRPPLLPTTSSGSVGGGGDGADGAEAESGAAPSAAASSSSSSSSSSMAADVRAYDSVWEALHACHGVLLFASGQVRSINC